MCDEDRRVHAAVNMDGWFFGAIRERGPSQPLLVMYTAPEQAGETPDPGEKVGAVLDATDLADTET